VNVAVAVAVAVGGKAAKDCLLKIFSPLSLIHFPINQQ
jgi:hypothetical protein